MSSSPRKKEVIYSQEYLVDHRTVQCDRKVKLYNDGTMTMNGHEFGLGAIDKVLSDLHDLHDELVRNINKLHFMRKYHLALVDHESNEDAYARPCDFQINGGIRDHHLENIIRQLHTQNLTGEEVDVRELLHR